MKKLLILAVFLLSSCIWVDDFGVYWDKGVVDPVLEGAWYLDDGIAHTQKPESTFRFVKKDTSYVFEQRGKNVDEKSIILLRSISAKRYTFMMTRKTDADNNVMEGLVRYVTDGESVKIYEPHTAFIKEWVIKHYPNSVFFSKNTTRHVGFLATATLNEEVLAILDAIPDEEKYWKSATMRKLK